MRCAAYIRVSTDKEDQKLSLTNQQRIFYDFISNKSWDLFDIYLDVQSGTTDKRPQLQRLISDARERKFDVIIAKELSRLARNGKLSYQIRDVAEQHGIHIITLDNAINTLEGNVSNFGLFTWLYEQESQRTGERVKAALKIKAKKGEFSGSNPPYGYDVEDGKLKVRNDETPLIVKRIFDEYLEGSGYDKIARGLYNEGFPTPAKIAGKKMLVINGTVQP
jgi:site-specific DNA recombinase